MNKFFRTTYFLLPILFFSLFIFNAQAATGTIDGTYNTAKFLDTGDGTLNFNCSRCTISINDSAITGNAWGDAVGWINFNPGHGGVLNNISGVLSGNAWGQNTGWINFNPGHGGVSINTSSGEFNGYAWSQNDGWIKFDCSGPGKIAGQCVKTDWRPTVASGGGGSFTYTPPAPTSDLCSNLPDVQTVMPTGYAPDIRPDHLGECVAVTNSLNVEIAYPADNATFLSANASQQEIDSLPTPKIPLANFKIQAKVTSGTAQKVEFSLDGGSTWILGVYNQTDGVYETPNPWQQSVQCESNQATTFPIKVRATDTTGLITNEKDIQVSVGRLPCIPMPTECSDGIDNDNDGLIDRADPGCWVNGLYNPLLDNENTDSCATNPNTQVCLCTPSLPTYDATNPVCSGIVLTTCQKNPNDPSCSFCAQNPSDPSCSFCALNPSDPSCVVAVQTCATDSSLPGCNTLLNQVKGEQAGCATNPNLPGCKAGSLSAPVLGLFSPAVAQKINLGLKIAATISVAIGAVLSLSTTLFLNPLSLSELALIPFRLWSLFLTALGLKKRVRKWGTVYDSITKQPLDPVYVSLVNLEGEEIDSSITDIDGRYGFFVKPGVYKVIPKKTNYLFPSDKLSKHFSDEFYQDLYFGDYLNIGEGQVIVKNIPLDPIGFDWNEFAKNKKQLFKFYSKRELLIARISNLFFIFGFTVSVAALIISPEKYNIIILGLYVAMYILRRTSFTIKANGRIFEADGSPLAYAYIRLFSIETNVEIAHKVTDLMGRYYMIVPNGKYSVKIEKKNDDGTYSVIHTADQVEVIHGVLNKVFNI